MKCPNPFSGPDGHYFGCGQCWPCRENKKRGWTTRCDLEAACHEFNAFVTLTEDDEHQAKVCTCKNCAGYHPDGTLSPSRLNKFHKDVRYRLHKLGRKYRYFAVGEYGDITFRPHYHDLLFGISHHPVDVALIKSCWPYGHVDVQEYSTHTAAYCTGYVVSKIGKKVDPRLGTRHPTFSVMSRNPGIGGLAADSMSEGFTTKQGSYAVINGEPPSEIITYGKRMPLPRFMRERIKQNLGLPNKGIHSDTAIRARLRIAEILGKDEFLPEEQRRMALINKTEYLRRSVANRRQIFAMAKRGRFL